MLDNFPHIKAYWVMLGEETASMALNFGADDLDGTIRDWTERGVTVVKIPWSEDDLGTANCPYGRFIPFEDPFGNTHELMQPT